MQLKLNKEFRNNPLLHGLIVRLIISAEEGAHPAVIGFEHLNGIGGLDEIVIPGGIIVRMTFSFDTSVCSVWLSERGGTAL